MLVQRHLDAGMQFGFLKWLGNVTQRYGKLGARERGGVGVGGEVDHRKIEAIAQDSGGFDAVHLALDADIHQSQIGLGFLRLGNRLGAARNGRRHRVTEFGEDVAQIFGGDPFVFHDENSCGHLIDGAPDCWVAAQAAEAKMSWTSVPVFDFTSILAPNCSANERTKRNPKDLAVGQSISLRRPIPLSATTNLAKPSECSRSSIRTSPSRPSGKAYLSEFDTSSLMISPQGTAETRLR